MTNKRFFRPKPKELIGSGYDSRLEKRIGDRNIEGFSHHPERLSYIIPHTYQADFLFEVDGNKVFCEMKGYLQDTTEVIKYPHIRDILPKGDFLIFVFEDPLKPIHFKAKRKDGTKMNHKEWATKNKFVSYSEDEFTALLISGLDKLLIDIQQKQSEMIK